MGNGNYGVEVIVDRIILMVYGLVLLFFWGCSYGLAKDRARRGVSLGRATTFSLSFILGVTLALMLIIYVLLRSGVGSGNIGTVLLEFVGYVGELVFLEWKTSVVLLGMLMSALLGAYFGMKLYHEVDKDYVEPE